MEIKKKIEEVLEVLKKAGFDRGRIEADMGYSENYIDQTLSRGGNEKFLKAMVIYKKAMLQNATPPQLNKTLVDDRLMREIEARRQDFEHWAELARMDKEKAEKEKDRLLTIIENNLTALLSVTGRIDANLKEAQSDLFEIENSQRVQHTVMMHSLERIEGEPGRLDKELDTLEHASRPVGEQSGKSSG